MCLVVTCSIVVEHSMDETKQSGRYSPQHVQRNQLETFAGTVTMVVATIEE